MAKKRQEKKRYLWADLIRIVAIYCIVFRHNSFFLPHTTLLDYWLLTPYLYTQFGVALFAMLSGALLLGKNESYKTFFGKRSRRLLLPWVFWIGVYSCIDVFFNHMKFGSVYDFLQYNYQMFFSRFWFLPMVAVLYLMTPIVKIVQKYASKRDLIYALSLWFFAFSLMPFFYLLFSHRQQPLDSSLLRLSFQHVGLYLLGYMLVTGFLHKVRLRSWGIVIILSLILSYFGLSFQALFNRGPIDGFFLLAFSPTMLPSVLAIFMILFLLAKKWDKTISPGLRALFREMSEAALGIYLIHEIVMQVVRFSFPGVDTYLYSISPFLSIPLRTTLIFLLAFVVIFLIRRVPFLKYFV